VKQQGPGKLPGTNEDGVSGGKPDGIQKIELRVDPE